MRKSALRRSLYLCDDPQNTHVEGRAIEGELTWASRHWDRKHSPCRCAAFIRQLNEPVDIIGSDAVERDPLSSPIAAHAASRIASHEQDALGEANPVVGDVHVTVRDIFKRG